MTNLLIPAAFLADRSRWLVRGLFLPLLCSLPQDQLPFVALLGMLLPLLAPSRGDPAGFFLSRWLKRRAPATAVSAREQAPAPTPT